MLGLEDQIVGVTRHCNYPAEALTKRKVGTFWQPDVEAVLAVRPTLVIAEDFERQRQLTEQLNRIGCNTLTVRIESIPQLLEGIATIGRAVYRVEEAESLVNRLMTAQQEMRCRYAEGTRPKVLWVIQRQPLRVAGTKTFVNEMIEIAGGVNAIGPTMNIYPPIGAEQVIAAWPDVIIEPTDEPELLETQTRSAKAFYEAFRTIPAVENERIYVIDGDLVSRLGRGWIRDWMRLPVVCGRSKDGFDGEKASGAVLVAAVFLAAVMTVCLAIGSESVSLYDVLRGPTSEGQPSIAFEIIVNYRLPRIVLAAIIGRHWPRRVRLSGHIAKSAGRSIYSRHIERRGLGTLAAVLLGWTWTFLGMSAMMLMAFVGALVTTWLVWGIGRAAGRVNITGLLLAGVVVNAFFSSVIMF